jgi:hypothetical protein
LKGLFLIQDNDSIHTAGATRAYFDTGHPWWRARYTPAHASWLNQAEISINMLSQRYLKRASWQDREEFIQHVLASMHEYNQRYAHPIEWT